MDEKDIEFEIELAKIGMRFGAWFVVGVAVFAIGATLLFTIYEHLLLEGQLVEEIGLFFLVFGVIITVLAKRWTSTALSDLKKSTQ